jgi:hypothetical protein
MCTDFSAIDDLRTQPYDDPAMRTPAHLDEGERAEELETWQDPPIRTLTFATLGGRPFRFRPGVPAPVWELTSPSTYPEIAKDPKLSEGSDVAYRLCYRACAGGPFRMPPNAGTAKLPPGFSRLEVWDNDGVVNTASMLWPPGGTVELVRGDHLDIVGHYKREPQPQPASEAPFQPSRRYRTYDALKSKPRFTAVDFKKVWTEIFEFSTQAAPMTTAAGGGV